MAFTLTSSGGSGGRAATSRSAGRPRPCRARCRRRTTTPAGRAWPTTSPPPTAPPTATAPTASTLRTPRTRRTPSAAGGAYDIGWTAAGQWFKYTVEVATAGIYTVSFRVAAPAAVTDALHIANSSGANLTGAVAVPDTGGYQTWTTVTASVTLPAGEQTLTVDQDAAGWNLHYLAFAQGSSGGRRRRPARPSTAARRTSRSTSRPRPPRPRTPPTTRRPTPPTATPAPAGRALFSDPQWLEVDLGSPQQICSVGILLGGRVRHGVPDPGVQRQLDLDHGLLHDDRHRREPDVHRLRRPPATSACTARRAPPSSATRSSSSTSTA